MLRFKAFTLIELMVVIFVISLILGMATFSMGVFQTSHDLENTTQALSSRLRLAAMEATFDQEALGMAVDESGYRFYRKDAQTHDWVLITDDSLFKAQAFPAGTDLSLTIDGVVQNLSQTLPQLVLKQGEIHPFSLKFKDKEARVFEISLNAQGEIVWTPE